MNAFGVPKPSYRAYQLLHHAHDFQQPVTRTAAAGAAEGGAGPGMADVSTLCALTTGVVATTSAGSAGTTGRLLQLLLYNHREYDAPDLGHPNPSVPCEVTVVLDGSSLGWATLPTPRTITATARVIDETHANPRGKWIDLGMPSYPSPTEHAEILLASQLVTDVVAVLPVPSSPAKRELKVLLAKHSAVAVDLSLDDL